MLVNVNGTTAAQEYKDQLNNLMMAVFGFSFRKFHALNLWDDEYECFSIIENNIMIANISVYHMQLLLGGKQREFLQLGAVATRPEYRGRGLSRRLMEEIFQRYPDTPAFLYANDSVLDFYPKFGFEPIGEKQPYVQCQLAKRGELERLEIIDPRLDQYVDNRTRFSKRLDCVNPYAINWFHLAYEFWNDIYEIPELETMLVMRQFENRVVIVDAIAHQDISFEQLVPHLHFDNVDTIEFGFCPDWFLPDYDVKVYEEEDSTFMVKGWTGSDLSCFMPRMIRT